MMKNTSDFSLHKLGVFLCIKHLVWTEKRRKVILSFHINNSRTKDDRLRTLKKNEEKMQYDTYITNRKNIKRLSISLG